MSSATIFMYILLAVWVIYYTKKNNMWGVGSSTQKARDDAKLYKKQQRKIVRVTRMLGFFAYVSKNAGLALSRVKEERYTYQISRMGIRVKTLGKPLKAEELDGVLKIIQFVGLFLFFVTFIPTRSPFSFMFFILFAAPGLFNTMVTMHLKAEDDSLEQLFPDLYFVLYNRLIKGSHARLAPVLTDYLSALGAETKENKVMRQFVKDFRNNIDIYGQDYLAIVRLRDKYKSVMIVNFCNLAVQAMNGVDNKDKLLTFRMELTQQRTATLRKRADKVVRKGNMAIYMVYVILGQFILLSFAAKIGPSMSGLLDIFGK